MIDDADPDHRETGAKYTFYVNTSNKCFETDRKNSREDPAVVEAKFVYANVLVGLGLLNDSPTNDEDSAEPTESPEERVATTTKALAPVLLPMIDFLGTLSPEELSGGEVGDED